MSTKLDVKDIDAAFAAAPLALRVERTDADKNVTKKFLLHNLDYYNLQVYIHTGMELPGDPTAFQTLFPKDHLEKLMQIDGEIYEGLQSTFTLISTNCLHFEHETMWQFMTVTGAVINYCKDMDRYMTGPGLLLDQINIVTADGADSTSPAWAAACNKIKLIMGILGKRAASRIGDIERLVADLTAFKSLTEVDLGNIDYLKHQFLTGETVYNSRIDRTPSPDQNTYSTRLNNIFGELESQIAGLHRNIAAEEEERQHDIVVAATAVTYAVIWPIGTIAAAVVGSVYGARAEALRGKIAGDNAKLPDDIAQEAALKTSLGLVTKICGDIRNVSSPIEKALVALTDLKASFNEQQIGFQNLANQWSTINNSASQSGSADEAALDMKPSVESAKASWVEIKELALDFQTNSAIQYVNVSPPAPRSGANRQ